MKTNNQGVPDELQRLNLTADQLQGAQQYLSLQLHYARLVRRCVLGLIVVVAASLTFAAMASDVSQTMPFETLAEGAMRYLSLAAAGLAVLGVVFFEVLAHRDRKAVQGWLGLSPSQAAGVRDCGDMVARYVLFGWTRVIGFKQSKGGKDGDV